MSDCKKTKHVALISTGGTIEMHSTTSGISITNKYNPLLFGKEIIPQCIDVEHIEFSQLPSPHIYPCKMAELCRYLEKLALSGKYDGIVVTHGTDTLEETAFLADIYIDSGCPIVFTAAMRSADEMGVDGPRNLRGAFLTSINSEVHKLGITVVLNDEIHAAGKVTKTYTSNISSFNSPGFGPLGFVDYDRVILHRIPIWRIHLPPGELQMEQAVGLIRIAAGYGADLIKHCIDGGDKGLVVEALGRGNVPPDVADAIEYGIKKNVAICVTSRCYMGRTLGVYGYCGGGVDLEKRGAILAGDMQGHKMRLLLMAALGKGMSIKEIKKMLEKL